MSYLEIFLLALALSIDASVVSFTYGLTFEREKFKTALQLASFTGFFQGFMPIIAYLITNFVKTYIEPFASIIVFLIFTYLGFKFIIEAFEKKQEKKLCLGFVCLLLIGIATSIDAFSAGISLLLSGNKIVKPAILITMVTFFNALLGFYAGRKLKHLPTKNLEIVAGLILIGLGIKAFF